ncbi:VanZ family protein [Lunatibacter salilacus]|uniref:VanZ family protein n=1 Tax=Lunatibacter salilacus TaxID=2483804 RepID=UPI00131EAF06|nr:VanZ family protein [Lunatibacter salilacus]
MRYRIIPALVWTSGVAYAILTPGSNVPELPKFPGFDKVIHFTLFFGLVFLWNRVWVGEKNSKNNLKKISLNYLVFGIIFAIFTELLQMNVPGRSFDSWDIVANVSGGTIGTILYVYLTKKQSKLV